MLPKKRRLTTEDVQDVLKKGRPSRAEHLSVKYLTGEKSLSIAAVVSKSLVKKAVGRNKIRRAVYRAAASLPGNIFAILKGRAIVFVNKVPQDPLAPIFAAELATLLENIRRHV